MENKYWEGQILGRLDLQSQNIFDELGLRLKEEVFLQKGPLKKRLKSGVC